MLSDLARRYEQHLKRRGLAARSVETYRRGLDHFLAFLSERQIERADQIARETVRAYQTALYTGKSRHDRPFALKTQALFLQVVQSFLKFLVREGVLLLNPADRLEMPRPGPRHAPRNVPSEDEVERLIEACDSGTPQGVRDRAILEVLYSTGVRVGELVALKLYDVDVSAGLVRVIAGKGGKDRVVPLGRLAARALRAYLDTSRPHYVRGRPMNTLFVSRRGRNLRRTDVRALIVRYVGRAGLDRTITPHTLPCVRDAHAPRPGLGAAHPGAARPPAAIHDAALYPGGDRGPQGRPRADAPAGAKGPEEAGRLDGQAPPELGSRGWLPHSPPSRTFLP